jgi:anti-sigma factor RsiW
MMEEAFDVSESERLVQRFVDQELSAEERVHFVARLGRDEALRRRAIELEQLALDVGRLPRPAVPDGFVSRVMERAVPARTSLWRERAHSLLMPRTLQWNLAGAMAAVCLLLLAVGGMVSGGLILNQDRTLTDAAGASGAVATSAASMTQVRLVVLQPGATTVQVAGDFNGWNPALTSLEQISDGAWAVTIPLRPGRYEYMFVVDGHQWIADPFAAELNDDGFGSRNAVLDVRPALDGPASRASS